MPIKFDTTTRTPIAGGEGGEGYIYEYNGKIIKTFKPHVDISAKQRKVNALMKSALPKEVIAPIDEVLDMNGKFTGYCMEKVTGEDFKRLSNRKFVIANNITTKDILSMLIKIKTALEDLHKKNIFIGDLNDQNILFDTAGNVYLIDCDSWAVGNDKCTVAMDLFKDPKLKADNFNADTDNYAFMVLAWKSLTRVHPFGGTLNPDIPILDLLEDSKGDFHTFVINKNSVEYGTDSIRYDCQLNCPCIYNSTIYIPIGGKIRGYSYQKSLFKDFECGVVSEESKLIKEKNRFAIVNLENVYYLEK